MDSLHRKLNILLGFFILCFAVPFSVVGAIFLSLGASNLTKENILGLIHPAYFGSVLIGTTVYFLAGRIIHLKKWGIGILAFGTTILNFLLLYRYFLYHDVSAFPKSFTLLLINPKLEELIIYTLIVLAIFWLADWIFLIDFRKAWLANILVFAIVVIVEQFQTKNQLPWVFGLGSSYVGMIAILLTLLIFLTDFIFLLFWEFSSRGKDLRI